MDHISERYKSGLTINEIAELEGVSYTKIRNHLIKNGIPIRSASSSKRKKLEFPDELESKDWLFQNYCEKELSLKELAEKLNTTQNRVGSALRRFSIPLRTKSEGQRLRYKKNGYDDYFVFNQSVIEGCLLGDGFMKISNHEGDCYPNFCKRNIYKDHIEFVASFLFKKESNNRIKLRDHSCGYPNAKPIYELSTLCHFELLDVYKRWYNGSERHVPNDLLIDKSVLLHWFLDDGYSYFVNTKGYRYLRIQFATQCFDFKNLQTLCSLVLDQTGLKMYPRFHQRNGKIQGYGYYLELSQKQNDMFYDLIGPSPVRSMDYKWKLT